MQEKIYNRAKKKNIRKQGKLGEVTKNKTNKSKKRKKDPNIKINERKQNGGGVEEGARERRGLSEILRIKVSSP